MKYFLDNFVLCFLILITFTGSISAEEGSELDFVETFYPIIYEKEEPSVFLLVDDIDVRTSLNFKRAVLEVGPPDALILASNGGLVHVGLDLALEVASLGIVTYIPEGLGCYSSCSFVFLAGQERLADGELGVHQISGTDDDFSKGQLALSDIIDVLNKFDTPPELYAIMLRTKATEMYILSDNEIEGMGLLEGRRSLPVSETQKQFVPDPNNLENDALDFVKTANFLWTGVGVPNPELIRALYDHTVDYYGKNWSNSEVYKDKFSFANRWPIRQYNLDLSKSRATCPKENYCQVTGHVIWKAEAPDRNKKASGESRFEYLLRYENGQFFITKENSLVVRRD